MPAVDILIGIVCLALAWAELLVWHEWSSGPRVVQAAGITIACSSLVIRRRFPFATVVVAAGGSLLTVVGGVPPQILGVGLAAMMISYSFAAALDGAALLAAVALFTTTWLIRDIVDPHLNGFDIAIDGVFVFGMPFVVGRVMRRRERQVDLVSRVADDRTDDAIRQERARIARELHDVIAHGMSVMVVRPVPRGRPIPSTTEYGRTMPSPRSSAPGASRSVRCAGCSASCGMVTRARPRSSPSQG